MDRAGKDSDPDADAWYRCSCSSTAVALRHQCKTHAAVPYIITIFSAPSGSIPSELVAKTRRSGPPVGDSFRIVVLLDVTESKGR